MRHGYTVEVYPVAHMEEDQEYPFHVPMIVRGGAWFLATDALIKKGLETDADAVKAAMEYMVRDGIACALDDEDVAEHADLHWVPAQWEEEDTA